MFSTSGAYRKQWMLVIHHELNLLLHSKGSSGKILTFLLFLSIRENNLPPLSPGLLLVFKLSHVNLSFLRPNFENFYWNPVYKMFAVRACMYYDGGVLTLGLMCWLRVNLDGRCVSNIMLQKCLRQARFSITCCCCCCCSDRTRLLYRAACNIRCAPQSVPTLSQCFEVGLLWRASSVCMILSRFLVLKDCTGNVHSSIVFPYLF